MSFRHRIANLFRREKVDAEIAAELRAHIEMRVEDNIAAGMPAAEARRDALVRFGNPVTTRENVTAADTALAFAGMGRELRFALRRLRRSPGFALTAVLTLMLGIGANVIVLSVLRSLVINTLQLPEADRLYNVVKQQHGDDAQSYPDFLDYKAQSRTMDMAAYRLDPVGIMARGSARKGWVIQVSTNYFQLLRIRPALGRFFTPEDEHGPNSTPLVVLSDATWRSRFNADPLVLGSTIELDHHPFIVIGVAPPNFFGVDIFAQPDLWMPMVNEMQVDGYDFLTNRGSHGLWIIGKLRPGSTAQQATDELNAISRRLSVLYPRSDDGIRARLVKPGLMGDLFRDAARNFLLGTFALSSLVLLAACANLASLFAARAADRRRELAIRLAIGASRWYVLRGLVLEALLTSLAGGLLGSLLALVILRALTRWRPFDDLPIHIAVTADAKVYAVALALSVSSGLLFGLLPARQAWRTDAARAMKSGDDGSILTHRFNLRDALLALQIAICTVLVMASLVAMRGMQRTLHAPVGFHAAGVMLAATDTLMGGYSGEGAWTVQRRLLTEAAKIPGVSAVGSINDPPMGTGGNTTAIFSEGTTDFRSSNSVATARTYSISPDYLAAADTRLLSGRDFTWHDDAKAPRVALVNATLARRIFGSAPAIGRRFFDSSHTEMEIVGIVEDGKYETVTETPTAAIFRPALQSPNSWTTLVVRSDRSTQEIAAALNRTFHEVDPGLPVTIQSWPDALGFSLFPARVATATLGVLGMLAALLAVTGIFGMAAYIVSRRLHELGIRLALGAQRGQLLHAALRRPLLLLLGGSMAGLLFGMLASPLLAQVVYQATPRDPVVLAGVILAMIALGLLATWLPARRAVMVDPARLLRED